MFLLIAGMYDTRRSSRARTLIAKYAGNARSIERKPWLGDVVCPPDLYQGDRAVVYGPIFAPDGSDHIRYADIIFGSNDWLHHEDLTRGGQPITLFRATGYPAVLALMKFAGGGGWPWLIMVIQFSISLLASFFVFWLTVLLSGRHWLGLCAAFSHGIGQTIVLDQSILTDSLNASLLLIMSCHLGISILSQRQP